MENLGNFLTRIARFYRAAGYKKGSRQRARLEMNCIRREVWHPERSLEPAAEMVLTHQILARRGNIFLLARRGYEPFLVRI